MKHFKLYHLTFFLLITNLIFCQQQENIDFLSADVNITVHPDSSMVQGSIKYVFDVLSPCEEVLLDAKNTVFKNVKVNDKLATYKNDNSMLSVSAQLKPSTQNSLTFKFKTKVKQAMYFLKRNDAWNIWTQGQGKYTSNWLPSIDDVNDKIEFDLKITFDSDYEVLANGKLLDKKTHLKSTTWHYDMQHPMSSYLVAVVIGKYDKIEEQSKSGVPLSYFYYPEDSLKLEPTYRYTKQIFDFFEAEIGVPFPWQNYKQVPVHDFLYAGMENTSLTIFSDTFVVDDIGFNDQNYVNVNAHELAHQWFGNLVTATSGEHHWLQEGFATYYALLAEREVFGEDYFYFKWFEYIELLRQQDLNKKGTSLLDPTSSSTTFYQRGAWVLFALKEKVGETVFKNAVKNYLKKHQFNTVETTNFIAEIEKLYGKPIDDFVNLWIKNETFSSLRALELLKSKSSFINEYVMVDCEAANSKCFDYLKYGVSDEAKVKVINQNPSLITKDTFKSSRKVRQAIATYLEEIPIDLKKDYETLLKDNSYLTIENALYHLWSNFPKDAKVYLDQTKDIFGLNNGNVRLLWLVLALNTPDYNEKKKQDYFDELINYTNSKYHFELRMNAFSYLKLIKGCQEKCIEHLTEAVNHHHWRMKNFAKQYFETLNN